MELERKLTNYHMSDTALKLVQKTPLLLVSSVAGGGKDTIVKELMKSGEFHRIVSHTTRSPRINHGKLEQDGEEYHFVTTGTAEAMVDAREFIEAKYVHGNVYGTSVSELAEANGQGKIAATDVDIQGVVEYLSVKSDTHAVFLLPPSVDTWLQRLSNRYGNLDDHKEEITKRFTTAYDEIKHVMQDKRFVLVINDDLETTVQRVRGVVDGSVQRTSDYAEAVAEHILDFLESKLK